jgi:cytochrome P450
LMMDGSEHSTYRALAQPAFAAATLRSWEVRWLGPILERLLTDLAARRRADLYMGYSARFPAHTIGSAFGVSEDDVDQIHDWVIRTQTNMPANQSAEAGARLTAYFRPIIEDRRSRPADDVISLLVTSDLVDGAMRYRLTDAEIMGFCGLLLIAGVGTTYRSTGILLLTLLHRPALLEQVAGDRSLIPQVVEEVLRWEPPLTSFSRLAVADTELAGVAIPAGSIVDVGVAAANRDGRRWEDPHTFDPFRFLQPHLGFGRGPHFCIGNQLARMEMRVSLNRLLDCFPDVRLDTEAPPAFVTGVFYRMPTAVPALLG